MLRFLVLSTLVASAFGNIVLPRALLLPDGRIVGGVDATIEEFPYQVSVQVNKNHICGGSIIGKIWVLTAGHCCAYKQSLYTVVYGTTELQNDKNRVKVKEVIQHEEYNPNTIDKDVCVLELADEIIESNKSSKIGLTAKEPCANQTAIATGWGTKSEGGSLSKILQAVVLQIISRLTCEKAYNQINDITSSMICAGKAGKDSCQGDSGGALVVEGKQAGIVSWGVGCAHPDYPGVYTNVAEVLPWINDKTGLKLPEI